MTTIRPDRFAPDCSDLSVAAPVRLREEPDEEEDEEEDDRKQEDDEEDDDTTDDGYSESGSSARQLSGSEIADLNNQCWRTQGYPKCRFFLPDAAALSGSTAAALVSASRYLQNV